MKSPFAIFRKHQRVLTVVLTGLAMFAFIIMGSLDPSSRLAPIVMCAAVGAGVFWVIGLQNGTQNSKAAIGLAVGIAVGLLLPSLGGRAAAVESKAGSISSQELQSLVQKRQIANQFLNAAYSRAVPMPSLSPELEQLGAEMQNRFLMMQMQQWEMGRQNFQFSFGQPTLPRDVVMGYLYRAEADKMGLVISDEAVSEYIKLATQDNLSSRAFNEITREMRVGGVQLYDILRDEIKARQAYHLMFPRAVMTPEETWDYYRKFNVRQQLEAAAVPVDAFTSEIADPSQAELQAFFDRHKERFPSADGEPGFRQPRRTKLAYLEADYETIESTVPPVTDEEIQEFYNQNKELYEIEASASSTLPMGQDTAAPTEESPTNAEPKTEEGSAAGSEEAKGASPLDPEFTPETNQPKADQEAPTTEQPTQLEQSAPEQPNSDAEPQTDNQQNESDGGKADETVDPAASESATGDGEQAAQESSAKQEQTVKKVPAEPTPQEAGSEQSQDQADTSDTAGQGTAEQQDEVPASESPEASQTPQPAQQNSENPQPEPPAAENTPAETPATETSQPAENETEPPAQAPAQTPTATDASAASAPQLPPPPLPQTAGDGENADPAQAEASAPPAPQYRPLDNDLKSEIRDQLLRRRTFEAIRNRINQAHGQMLALGPNRNVPESDPEYMTAQQVADELKKVAQELNLTYVETPLLSSTELRESEDYPIGTAVEPSENPFERQNALPVAYLLFDAENEPVYLPKVAEDVFGSSRYAYWAVEYVDEHVPTLDEPGVKQQVVEAWKREQARPLAEKRAKELLESARKQENSAAGLSESLAEQTVTGKTDAAALLVRVTPEFTWLTQNRPSNAPLDPFQMNQPVQVGLSDVPSIEGAGNEFMKTVFQELETGEIGVAPSEDRSIYYVVRVRSRNPSESAGMEALRQQYLQEQFLFSAALQEVAREDQRVAMAKWSQNLEARYEVRWNSEVFDDEQMP